MLLPLPVWKKWDDVRASLLEATKNENPGATEKQAEFLLESLLREAGVDKNICDRAVTEGAETAFKEVASKKGFSSGGAEKLYSSGLKGKDLPRIFV